MKPYIYPVSLLYIGLKKYLQKHLVISPVFCGRVHVIKAFVIFFSVTMVTFTDLLYSSLIIYKPIVYKSYFTTCERYLSTQK